MTYAPIITAFNQYVVHEDTNIAIDHNQRDYPAQLYIVIPKLFSSVLAKCMIYLDRNAERTAFFYSEIFFYAHGHPGVPTRLTSILQIK